MISFDNIPANLRTPGVYIEFNNDLAGVAVLDFNLLVLGQRLATGTVAEAVPVQVSSAQQAEDFFGRGSQLAHMLRYLFAVKPFATVWAIALDDDGAGVKAAGDITFTGAATKDGTLNVYVGGERVRVGVSSGDTADDVATAVAAAINAQTDYPVTAAVDGVNTSEVDVTARNAGEYGNYLSIKVEFDGASQPAAPTIAITAMAGGSGNPDIADAIAVMGDDWYNWIVCPWTDSANLTALAAELLDRWGPMRQIGARAFIAYRATLANTTTFGNGQNSHLISCMATNLAPQPPHVWAAVNAAVASNALSIDPARPLQTRILTGIQPPAREDHWTRSERNTLLYDGVSTYDVDRDGTVRIERQITMYQTNSAGVADASYLDINTPETLERIRYTQRSHIAQTYPNYKLADNGTEYGAGNAVVTPNLIRAQLLSLYRDFILLGWCEDYESYEASLVVERDAGDPNRINVLDHPNLVNQFRVYAGKVQFIV